MSYKISMKKVEDRISMKSVSAVPDVGRAERIRKFSIKLVRTLSIKFVCGAVPEVGRAERIQITCIGVYPLYYYAVPNLLLTHTLDVGGAERVQITSVEKLHQNSRFVSIEPKYLK